VAHDRPYSHYDHTLGAVSREVRRSMSRALRRFRIGDRSKSTQGYSPEMEERRGAGQAQVAALVIFRSLPVITVGQAMRPPTQTGNEPQDRSPPRGRWF
jgi:hypothetical protein